MNRGAVGRADEREQGAERSEKHLSDRERKGRGMGGKWKGREGASSRASGGVGVGMGVLWMEWGGGEGAPRKKPSATPAELASTMSAVARLRRRSGNHVTDTLLGALCTNAAPTPPSDAPIVKHLFGPMRALHNTSVRSVRAEVNYCNSSNIRIITVINL